MLFKGKFFTMKTTQIDNLLGTVDFDKPDRVVKNSKVVADLATLISSARSSAGQAFTYDVAECELWLKPLWLKVWLMAAKTSKFNDARILMHGMKSNDYEKLATDMSGFNMNFSQNGRYNYGFYASVSDHIASEYNHWPGLTYKYPDGTFVIGLLWTKSTAKEGAYENYHLGSKERSAILRVTGLSMMRTSYVVRDQRSSCGCPVGPSPCISDLGCSRQNLASFYHIAHGDPSR